MSITNEELTQIKERAERLVDEKWYYDGETICESQRGNPVITGTTLGDVWMSDNVGEFIAHAREDVPRLVAEVKRLRTMKKMIFIFAIALILASCSSESTVSMPGMTPSSVDNNEVFVYKDAETGCEYLLFKSVERGGIIPRLSKGQDVKGCGEALRR